jgi:hypothetical protein
MLNEFQVAARLSDEITGILVFGDNHLIVSGPRPREVTAVALVRLWSVIQINGAVPAELAAWRIVSKAFREELSWAVVVDGDGGQNPAVAQLLAELRGRAVVVDDYRRDAAQTPG